MAPMTSSMPRTPWTKVLDMESQSGITVPWQAVDIFEPTICYPYADDAQTGSFSAGADGGTLRSLEIAFWPFEPGDLARQKALPAGNGGVCYLSHPGRWFIHISSGSDGGAGFGGKIPFLFVPDADLPFAQQLMKGKLHNSAPNTQPVLCGLGSAAAVTVQELLQGATALEVAIQDEARAGYRLRWGREIGGSPASSQDFTVYGSQVLRFEGNTLPLADLWALSVAGGFSDVIKRTLYF